jgi:hypothetical protein
MEVPTLPKKGIQTYVQREVVVSTRQIHLDSFEQSSSE